MSKQYIHIDSTWRNRIDYPNPCHFNIPIGSKGAHINVNSTDAKKYINPISLQAPYEESPTGAFMLHVKPGFVASGAVAGTMTSVTLETNGEMDDFFNGMEIEITSGPGLGQKRVISDYVSSTKVATVSEEWSIPPTSGSEYKIYGTIELPQSSSIIDNIYAGDIFEMETIVAGNFENVNILSYDGSKRLLTVDGLLNSAATGSMEREYAIRKQLAPATGAVGAGSTTTTVVCGGGAAIDDIYNGKLLRIKWADGAAPQGEVRYIDDYVGSTTVATVDRGFSVAPDNTAIYEILDIEYEAENGINLDIQSRNPGCYNVKISHLVIPGLNLTNGYKDKLQDYPYIGVELMNRNRNYSKGLYSNNPYLSKSLFVSPIGTQAMRDWYNWEDSNMNQTVPFQLGDSLELKILLPDGTIPSFGTDNPMPAPANPQMQLSCLLEISRVD
jgi:hypothetical protein